MSDDDDDLTGPDDELSAAFEAVRDLIDKYAIGQFEKANAVARLDEAAYWADRAL